MFLKNLQFLKSYMVEKKPVKRLLNSFYKNISCQSISELKINSYSDQKSIKF